MEVSSYSNNVAEHLDFMNTIDTSEMCFNQFGQVEHDYIGYQSLTDVPKASVYTEDLTDLASFENRPLYDVLDALRNETNLKAKCQLLGVLLKREGPNYEFCNMTVEEHLKSLYYTAGCLHYWVAIRYCSSLLHHTVDSISPFITTVLVNGKQLSVGVIGREETVFDKPLTPAEIRSAFYKRIQPFDITQAVLQQEIVLYCGRLIGTNPDMFKGILKIRVGWVLEAMKLYLGMCGKDPKTLENHSPYEVRQLLFKVLSVHKWATSEHLEPLNRRRIEGCLCRVPPLFYNLVWDIMVRTPKGIRVQGHVLPQQPTLTNMTRSELNFALLVEEILNHIQKAEYRQIIVELLCIVSTILNRNPELTFRNQLDLDELVCDAFKMFCKDGELRECTLEMFFAAKHSVTTGYLARAVVNNVLRGGQLATSSPVTSGDGRRRASEDQCRIQ